MKHYEHWIPPLLIQDNLITYETAKAKELNGHFVQQTELDDSASSLLEQTEFDIRLSDIVITESEIEDV